GLVGAGIAHSGSPALHGWFLRQTGRTGSYVLLPAPFGWAADHWLAAVRGKRLDGVNVTTPHKTLAARCCRAAEPAVNTVYRDRGELRACNTDGPGLLDALDRPLHGMRVLILGSGGAALACLPSVSSSGARALVCGRNAEATRSVAAATQARPLAWESTADLGDVDLVVHLTRFGHGACGPFRGLGAMDWLPWPTWQRRGTVVVDGVYSHAGPTWFEQVAHGAGANVEVGFGLKMLAAQAARSFERFAGCRPDWRAALAATSCTSA
ncbi:MAG: hypothetical protein FJ100_23015, partial [Deltaproteobacteria bacterium]|nr:hypothetical protein [Deltaproteobacteria bacterium]